MANTAAITPYLCVRNAVKALEFYKQAFGATETMRINQPDGRVGHAEIAIGGAAIMLSDEFPEMGIVSPQSLNGTPVTLHLVVDDADTVVSRAASAGATVERPVADQFYGMRSGTILDPFGHRWGIATVIEELTAAEIEQRAAAMSKAS